MTQSKSEYQVRIQKLDEIRAMGINPYVENFDKTYTVEQIIDRYDSKSDLRDSEVIVPEPQMQVATAGRVTLYRNHGKLSFARVQDGTGVIQVMFHADNCCVMVDGTKKETIGDMSAYKFIEKYIDVGDFIGMSGEVFRTHKGELTIFAPTFTLLTKSLLPLGDKFHGIEDMETRLRKRYLDTIFHSDVRDMLYRRSQFRQAMREFLLQHQFTEVETPILEVTTGGADANPFATHHDALDLDVYLRISCGELRQKRLMVAGFERTFEIGRIFRNEGMSPEHAQDYTQMENYRAYADYRQMMQLAKDMYLHIVDTVYSHKDRKFTIRGYEVDFNQERKEIDYATEIQTKTGIDIFTASETQIEQALDKLQVKYEPHNRIRLIDTLRKYCRKQIVGPAFLVNVPTFISPLAKAKVDNPELTNRFQIIIAGSEVGNGFSELNDPIDQRNRFTEQQAMRDAGDAEAQMADREYVEALEQGMPPTAGFGVSERLFCFLEDKPIREAQYFPLMKPEHQTEEKMSKETNLAVALINTDLSLEPRQQMNTIAHLTAAFGARTGKQLFNHDTIHTADDQQIFLNTKTAILIKQADHKTIKDLLQQAHTQGLHIAEFTREMLETTDDKKIIALSKNKKYDDIEHLGILIYGKKSVVESLTKSCTLFEGYTRPAASSHKPPVPMSASTTMPNRQEAELLAQKYLKETLRHCEQVGKVMHYFAHKLGQDVDARYIAGLLHDVDRDHIGKDPSKHLDDDFHAIVGEIGLPQGLIDDIRSHYTEKTGVPVDLLIRKYLIAVDELSGFIHAYSLMRPEGLQGMEAKSVIKKMKDKKFAAGVDREHLRNCEKYLNIPLEEFIPEVIQALQQN